jgi:uncharacterized membrane protein YagU involved in acid resistance
MAEKPSPMAEKPSPWTEVLKTLMLYVALPIGILVVIYYVLKSWVMGPANAVLDLWEKQYNDYVNELKQYSEADGGNLTPEHQTILEQKTKQMAQTEKTFMQVSGQTSWWIGAIYVVAFAIAARILYPVVVDAWKKRVKSGDVQSEQGAAYLAMCMMVDDLAARGLTLEATRLATVVSSRFYNVDAPYMQQQIAYYQSLLPTLTGWELLYASYIITAYQVTLQMVPVWMSYWPPPVLRALGYQFAEAR